MPVIAGLTLAELISLAPVIFNALTGIVRLIAAYKATGALDHKDATQRALIDVGTYGHKMADLYAYEQNTIKRNDPV